MLPPKIVERPARLKSGLAGYALFLRLTLAVRRLGMLVGRFGMAMSPRRFLTTLGVVAFAVMFRRGPVALRRAFMVFCCFGMGFPGHPTLLCRVSTA